MLVNSSNYKDYLLRMLENELTPAERNAAELYLLTHEDAAEEWQQLKKTKLVPDTTVVFARKALLMKEEEEDEVVPVAPVFRLGGYRLWTSVAAVAAMLLLALFFMWPQSAPQSALLHVSEGINGTPARGNGNKANNTNIAATVPGVQQGGKENKATSLASNNTSTHLIGRAGNSLPHIGNIKKTGPNEVAVINTASAVHKKKEQLATTAGTIQAPQRQALQPVETGTISNFSLAEAPEQLPLMRPSVAKGKMQPTAGQAHDDVLLAIGNDGSVSGSFVDKLKKKVYLHKRIINDQDYVAISVNTGIVHINKNIPSPF